MTEPLAVYVHWPYCARICPYCDFNVVRARGRTDEQAALAAAIVRDLEAQARLVGPRRLTSIFFGGGTPSLMDPAQVAAVIEAAVRLWPADEDLEISLEANPTDAEAGRFADLRRAGVDRLSLGLQSLDDGTLAILGRNHSAVEGRRAAEVAARTFPRLAVDLIYAVPGQEPNAWAVELAEAARLGAEHVSPYQLTIEAGTAFERAVRRGTLVPSGEDLAAELYETTQDVLVGLGYEAYEVSNHARGKTARSRHNLAYWRGWDYAGAGPGAHGRLTLGGVRTATQGCRGVGDYIRQVGATGLGWAVREALSPREAALERLLLGLRSVEGVPPEDLAALPLDPGKVDELRGQGLLQPGDRLVATASGRAVLDRITQELAG